MSKNELTSETKVASESEAEAPSAHSISPVDDELQQIASRARLDREIASQLQIEQKRSEREVADRLERGVVYSISREEQFKKALDRLAAEIRLDEQEQAAQNVMRREEVAELREERKRIRHQRHNEICIAIFDSLLEFAMDVQALRVETNNSISKKTLAMMREKFIAGDRRDWDDEQANNLLNERDYTHYVNTTGFWRPEGRKAKTPAASNVVWTRFGEKCEKIIHSPVVTLEVETWPTRLAIFGPSLSDFEEEIEYIVDQHNVTRINRSQLINDAITADRNNETVAQEQQAATATQVQGGEQGKHLGLGTSNRWDRLSKLLDLPQSAPEVKVQLIPTKKAEMGRRIMERRDDDENADIDDIVVELFTHHIRTLPFEKGWLLVGFPPTLNSIKMLEQDESMILQSMICCSDKEQESIEKKVSAEYDNKYDYIVPQLHVDSNDHMDYLSNLESVKQVHQLRVDDIYKSSPIEDIDLIINEATLKKTHQDDNEGAIRTSHMGNWIAVKSNASSRSVYCDFRQELAICDWVHRDRLTKALESLRELRNEVLDRADSVVPDFIQFISRPDARQTLMTQWINDFNRLDKETRSETTVQDEQHAKLTVFIDKLYDEIDQRKMESEFERKTAINIDGLDEKFSELLFYYVTLARQEVVSTIIKVACLRRHYAYQVELQSDNESILAEMYALQSGVFILIPIRQPDIQARLCEYNKHINLDTVDILGHALITFETILAEVSNLNDYELALCDEIDSTSKHRTVLDRLRTCQSEAKSGVQLLTIRCKAQLNNIHNHFSMQVNEIKTRFEKAFAPLDLLIERYFCDATKTVSSFEQNVRKCIQSNEPVDRKLVYHKSYTSYKHLDERDQRLTVYHSHYSVLGNTRLDDEESDYIAGELGLAKSIVEYARGDWRIMLFAATTVSNESERQLRCRADFDEFGMSNKKIDKSTWTAIMAGDHLAAKIGWSLNKNGLLSLSEILKIIDFTKSTM